MPASEPTDLGSATTAPTASFRLIAAAAAVYAVLMILAFPPVNAWFLAPLIPLPVAWIVLRAASTRAALLAALLGGLLAWFWMNRWIFDVTAIGYPAHCIYMTTYTVLFAWVMRRCALHRSIGRVPMTVLLPAVWTGIEYLRGDVAFHGYPWYMIGHPLIEWPAVAQSADLFGAYFTSFIAAIPAGALLDLSCRRHTRPRRFVLVTAAGAVIVANVGYGFWRIESSPASNPALHVLLIQTNLPQDNKTGWTAEQQAVDVPRFFEITADALAASRESGVEPDLIAWPETMLPGLGFERDVIELMKTRFPAHFAHQYLWHESMLAVVPQWNVPVVVGSSATIGARVEPIESGGGRLAWDHRYNSAYLLTPDGQLQRYDKFFLTPFGETMPYISSWPWLEERLLALGAKGMSFDLDSNDDLERLSLPDEGASFSTPICFEDTVARVCRRMVWSDGRKQSNFLINLSNDGWFGTFDGGRAHHVQIARFRTIENRAPMLRSVNTGYSLVIDSTGRVTNRIGDGRYGTSHQEGAILAGVTLDERGTLYASVGEAFPMFLLLMTVGCVIATAFLGPVKGSSDDPDPGERRSMS